MENNSTTLTSLMTALLSDSEKDQRRICRGTSQRECGSQPENEYEENEGYVYELIERTTNSDWEMETTERREEYTYLGKNCRSESPAYEEGIRRTGIGWSAFGINRNRNTNLSLSLQDKVFDKYVLPVLTHDGETWRLT